MTSKRISEATQNVAYGIAGALIWLGTWQWFTTAGPFAGIAGFPTMTGSVAQTLGLIWEPSFWAAVGETLKMAFAGLSIAVVAGLVVGLITGLSHWSHEALDPTIQFLRPLPPVVILPLVLLVLGPTTELGIFLAAFAAVWPILVQVQAGVRDVDPIALDTAQSMSLTWFRTQTAVVIPSAIPFIITGVKIAASAALLLSIGAGLLAGAPGLGKLILIAQEANQSDLAFGLILWSGVLGTSLALILTWAERTLVRGRRTLEEYS
ncbi:ABC transporter permease subunit (plasmid) [Arthrobacter sp. D3-18]